MKVSRLFRGATFNIDIRRGDVDDVLVKYAGQVVPDAHFKSIQDGAVYEVSVTIPQKDAQ